ncbi:MAG: acylneuraminate cytidylyltransferase family protein [Bacteroidetes bacterium]|nr:acylneuraminate cytidylyltransferase family protein [Bacteroidota bacterium]
MIAIIPARSGSKGLPGKNIKNLCGKPLIAYTIEAAKASASIEKVIVSTDDKAIAEIAIKYGADVPFLRPSYLSTDNSPAIDTYIYTVERLNNEFNFNINEFAVLQPTSPLRTSMDIDNAIKLFSQKNADSVISCCQAAHPPSWAKKINKDGILSNYFESVADNRNRQESEMAFMPNGAIYVFKYKLLKQKQTYYSDKTYAYIMPAERSFDIDSYFDFELAELYIKKQKHGTD